MTLRHWFRNLALVALLGGATACASLAIQADGARRHQPLAEHLATHVWRAMGDDPTLGGFSAIELSADGHSFHVLSDRGWLRWGRIHRDAAGRITDMETMGHTRLRGPAGNPLPRSRIADSEGMAIGADGAIWISFEGTARVVRYATPESPATPLPTPPEFGQMQFNSSLEALALTDDGTIYTLPERSGAVDRPFPVWRYRNGAWDQPFSVSRQGKWLPVGADIGPDGRFYLLERDFKGLLGFSSRVRRFDLTETGLENETILLQSRPLQFDNLEGMSVWHDGTSLRLTMVSDNNFNRFQRTEIVEFRLPDLAGNGG